MSWIMFLIVFKTGTFQQEFKTENECKQAIATLTQKLRLPYGHTAYCLKVEK